MTIHMSAELAAFFGICGVVSLFLLGLLIESILKIGRNSPSQDDE